MKQKLQLFDHINHSGNNQLMKTVMPAGYVKWRMIFRTVWVLSIREASEVAKTDLHGKRWSTLLLASTATTRDTGRESRKKLREMGRQSAREKETALRVSNQSEFLHGV